MMRSFTYAELARACGVVSDDQRVFSGRVVIDSRKVQSGDIFVALRGERFDGHDFLPSVVAAGAVAAIVEKGNSQCGLTQWIVPDCVQALGKLAKLNRDSFSGKVIGLTGSAGKTTTKEIIAAILAQGGNPLVTEGNLNNHLGVPLTLLRLSPEHDCAVIEMGASALGEIRYLSGLVQPGIALVTLVAPAHVEGFGSIENVALGKSEIYESLPADGVAVINLDNEWTSTWLAAQRSRTQVMSYSIQDEHIRHADISAVDIRPFSGGMLFSLCVHDQLLPVQLGFLGKHNVANAVAAAACCIAAGISLPQVVAGLECARPYKGRLQMHRGIQNCLVIDDSYNANPASVEMAMLTLMNVPLTQHVLVLGDMAELGSASENLHRETGERARELGVSMVLACGEKSAATVEGFGKAGRHFPHWQALRDACVDMADENVVFLVKGSRSAGMERVAEALINDSQPGSGGMAAGPGTQGRAGAC